MPFKLMISSGAHFPLDYRSISLYNFNNKLKAENYSSGHIMIMKKNIISRRGFIGKSASALLAAGLSPRLLHAAPLDFFELGVISDEVSPDLETGCRFVREFGLRWIELRSIGGKNIPDIDEGTAREAKKMIDGYGLRVSVIDTAFLKCRLPGSTMAGNDRDTYPYEEQYDMLRRACLQARYFSAPHLRIFTFWRVTKPEEIFGEMVEHLERALKIAAPLGVNLAVENEYACNVGTGTESAAMLGRIVHPNFGLVWDPGNSSHADEPGYPDGYEKIDKSRIMHVHLKDLTAKPYQWVRMGEGEIDYMGQFHALLNDGYRGTLSLETHYSKDGSKEKASRESMQSILRMIEAL